MTHGRGRAQSRPRKFRMRHEIHELPSSKTIKLCQKEAREGYEAVEQLGTIGMASEPWNGKRAMERQVSH